MKFSFSLLALLPLIFSFEELDLGDPPINAVCRITLKTGKQVEGMLVIVTGGYEGFRKNGFGYCFPGEENFSYSLFNADDFLWSGKPSYRQNTVTHERVFPELFFLSAQSSEYEKQDYSFDRNSKKLTLSVSKKYNYLALKSFKIYDQLRIELWLPQEQDNMELKIGATVIDVDAIERFELLVNPPEKWVNLIAQTRKKRDLVSNDWVDYLEPIWFHEIRNDKLMFNRLTNTLSSQSTITVNANN